MGIRSRVFLIVAVVLIGTGAIGVFQLKRVMSDEYSQLQKNHVSQISRHSSQLAQTYLKTRSEEYLRFSHWIIGEKEKNSEFPQSTVAKEVLDATPLLGQSLLQLGESGVWKPIYTVHRDNQYWFFNGISGDLTKKLPLAQASKDKTLWSRIEGASQRPFLLAIQELSENAGDRKILLSLLPVEHLSSMLPNPLQKDVNHYVVNNQGYLLSFPEQKYVGSSAKGKAFYRWVNNEISGHHEFKGEDERNYVGAFVHVPNSNITVITTTLAAPETASMALVQGNLVLLLLLAAVLLTGLLLLVFYPWEKGLKYLTASVRSLAGGHPVKRPEGQISPVMGCSDAIEKIQNLVLGVESAGPAPSTFSVDDQRILMQGVSAGVLEMVRGPLTAVLGHVQMARSKSGNGEVKEHLAVIEREARQVRDDIDRIRHRADASAADTLEKVDLRDVVLEALGSFKGELVNMGCRVVKELPDSVLVDVNYKQMKFAMEQVIANSIWAMKSHDHPELKVSLVASEEKAILRIRDNGVGLSSEARTKAFNPYFSTETTSHGLGLTLALGIVRAIDGKIDLKPMNVGTEALIEIPIEKKEKKEPAAASGVEAPVTRDPIELEGQDVLTGSVAKDLPTAPALDEVTLVGEIPDELQSKIITDETDESDVPSVTQEIVGTTTSDSSLAAESEENSNDSYDSDEEDEFKVSIRTPKVRVKS